MAKGAGKRKVKIDWPVRGGGGSILTAKGNTEKNKLNRASQTSSSNGYGTYCKLYLETSAFKQSRKFFKLNVEQLAKKYDLYFGNNDIHRSMF